METVRLRLAQARVKTIALLQALGIEPWLVPQVGMFLWCRLPQGKDAAALARSCLNVASGTRRSLAGHETGQPRAERDYDDQAHRL